VAETPCDLTDLAPTLLDLLGLDHAGTEGRPLRAAWDAAADAAPLRETIRLPRGFVLEAMRAEAEGRLYPTALRRDS
jgi:arylsulfatase A-like enzyme